MVWKRCGFKKKPTIELTQSTKDSIEFIRKYKELCQKDLHFEDKFMEYFEELIIDYQKNIITSKELDERTTNFLSSYKTNRRDKALRLILRKK